ncbi:MAG: PucR family transcriptional regulator [Conexibacter sp.]|nr:PucR family transcriptional regulator [Conexibacter sp.]
MATVEQLVESPPLGRLLSYRARPRQTHEVRGVALVEDVGELDGVAPDTIVLLSRGASTVSGTYRFDVALRVARSVGVAALVLSGPEPAAVTATAAAIADRAAIAILEAHSDVDLAELAVAIWRELAGGADAALLRAHTALRAVQAHPVEAPAEGFARRAGAALGVPISLVDALPAGNPSVPVGGDGHVDRWVTGDRQDGDMGLALDLVLAAVAAGMGHALEHAHELEDLPIQSRADVLTELLTVPPEGRDASANRARSLGIPIDGWHVAARLEFEELADAPERDGFAAFAERQALARAVLDEVTRDGGAWHAARSGVAAVLVSMMPDDPGVGASSTVAQQIDEALGRVGARLPTTLVRSGVGGAHPGLRGLLSSAAEAKAATSAARTTHRGRAAVPYDSVGLRRTLVEWYASKTAQDAISTVLAPLVELGGARSERLLQTLHVYLDEQGSLTKTAEALDLHRNAVAYRVNQIFSLLDVDPESPDDRLLLQLACRAREMAT